VNCFSILIEEDVDRKGKSIWRTPRFTMTTVLVKFKDSYAYQCSKLYCRLGGNDTVILISLFAFIDQDAKVSMLPNPIRNCQTRNTMPVAPKNIPSSWLRRPRFSVRAQPEGEKG